MEKTASLDAEITAVTGTSITICVTGLPGNGSRPQDNGHLFGIGFRNGDLRLHHGVAAGRKDKLAVQFPLGIFQAVLGQVS